MGNELITLNKILPMHNGTDGSTDGNSLINYFVSVAILAEMAVSKVDDFPWLVEEKLNNRRTNYEFDKHMILRAWISHLVISAWRRMHLLC